MIAEMLTCLALNVYHESKNQSLIGQYAVAQVTLNRVKDERFPNTICGVIEQGPISKWWLKEKGKNKHPKFIKFSGTKVKRR